MATTDEIGITPTDRTTDTKARSVAADADAGADIFRHKIDSLNDQYHHTTSVHNIFCRSKCSFRMGDDPSPGEPVGRISAVSMAGWTSITVF